MKNFLAELHRRNVFRMAVLYLVGGWALLSAADLLLNLFDGPEGSLRIIFFILAGAFPIALFLSWFFEITPEGLKLESDVDEDESIAADTGRRMNFFIAAAALLIFVGMAVQYFVFTDDPMGDIDPKSVAVLPFVDMSPDGDQEYFGDGVAEELLNLLAKIPDLKVAARTSAFSFKGKDEDITEIGRQLRVANVLEGSIRKANNQIRITAQLISVDDGYHLFSETYDRSMANIFAVQDEIAAAVVDQLKLVLLEEDLPTVRRTDPEVFNLFLQARAYTRYRTKEGLDLAQSTLEQALEIDPQYAPAWAELGSVWLSRAGISSESESYEEARKALEHALSIDPMLAEAWANLSTYYKAASWNFTKADEAIQKALSIDGRNPLVLRIWAIFALHNREVEKSLQLQLQILEQDPLSLALHVNIGFLYYETGDFDTSVEYLQKALTMSPNYSQGHYYLGMSVRAGGDPEAALLLFAEEPMIGRRLMGQAFAYTDLGREEEALATLAEFRRDHISDGWGPFIAYVHAYRGEADEAFELLDQAFEGPSPQLLSIQYKADFRNIHDDPRWTDFINRLDELKK